MHAYCYASGEIGFGPIVPRGAVCIATGSEEKLREEICAVSRHAYDGETLLVPGLPEAPNQMAAADALERFLDWIRPGFNKAGLAVPHPRRRQGDVR